MIFPEKMQLLRKSKGYTQESLAEVLNVSRQAIAKWEAAQGYPDISNLIKLSEVFCVTVDFLVKDTDCQKSELVQCCSFDKSFLEFLVKAKQKTYAGKGAEAESSRPLSHDLKYQEGNLLYIDTYLGGECFSGEEGVWISDVPVYAMNYSGRVLKNSFIGDFLKAALHDVPLEMPFRGPSVFQDGNNLYKCSVTGDVDWFQGYEEIYFGAEKVYECFFHGGKVK
ncbi:MAG: DUF5680 domain-containing protein [Treponema sp.]